MDIIDIPTEQTTAATNAILAVIVLVAAEHLKRIGKHKPWKKNVWVCAFYLLFIATTLGAITHGFIMSNEFRSLLWHPLYLSLGLFVSLFVVGSVYDVWSEYIARRILVMMLVTGVCFFVLTIVWSDSFIIFIIYEVLALIFALGGYTWLACNKRLRGASQIVAGILTTLLAAGIQTNNSIMITFIWQFDHNGVYHLIQMIGIMFLIIGLSMSIRSSE